MKPRRRKREIARASFAIAKGRGGAKSEDRKRGSVASLPEDDGDDANRHHEEGTKEDEKENRHSALLQQGSVPWRAFERNAFTTFFERWSISSRIAREDDCHPNKTASHP